MNFPPFPRLLCLAVMLAACMVAVGCSSLRESLGLDEQSEGNVYVGVGVLAQVSDDLGHDTEATPRERRSLIHITIESDAAGDVGGGSAKRDGSSGATATANIDPKAVAEAVGALAATAAVGSPRAGLLNDARAALNAGDNSRAAELVEAAKKASPDVKAEPAPPPAPQPAPAGGDGG